MSKLPYENQPIASGFLLASLAQLEQQQTANTLLFIIESVDEINGKDKTRYDLS